MGKYVVFLCLKKKSIGEIDMISTFEEQIFERIHVLF